MATVVCPECDLEASRLKNKDLLISLPSEDLEYNEVIFWKRPSFPEASVSSSTNSCPKCGFDVASYIRDFGGLDAYQRSVHKYKKQVEEYLSEYQRIKDSAWERKLEDGPSILELEMRARGINYQAYVIRKKYGLPICVVGGFIVWLFAI